jgi:hypothetical protein
MAATASMTVSELRDSLQRARATIRNLKEAGQEGIERSLQQLLMISGGASVGLMRGVWGDKTTGDVVIPGIEVEADWLIGIGLGAVAAFGVAGKASEGFNAYAGGFNAAIVAREIEQAFRTAAAKK